MRRAVICLLAGCFTKPEPAGSAPDSATDAPPPVDCSGVEFPAGVTVLFTEFDGTYPADPSLTANGLEMYLTRDPNRIEVPMTYRYEIERWTRTSLNPLFIRDTTSLMFNSSGADADPSLTADGSMIFFVSDRTGSDLGYFATRTSGDWSLAASIPGLPQMGMTSLDISTDGLALYFVDTANRLLMATRPERTADFGSPTLVGTNLGPVIGFPTVSADQLELFFVNGTGIQHATRETTAAAFERAPPAFTNIGRDPDLSADGETLVVAIANAVGVLSRTCPEP